MALLTCPDCGGKVSDSAPACPHCGRPMAKSPSAPTSPAAPVPTKTKKGSGCGTAVAVLVLFFVVVGMYVGGNDKPATEATPAAAKKDAAPDPAPEPASTQDPDCEKDLHCIGEKHAIHASVYCKDKIEAQAAHDVKWSDGVFSPSMSRYRWANAQHTALTYIGDKVAFQNGYGAFTPMTYFCTVDIATDAILDVQVVEGRIPTD